MFRHTLSSREVHTYVCLFYIHLCLRQLCFSYVPCLASMVDLAVFWISTMGFFALGGPILLPKMGTMSDSCSSCCIPNCSTSMSNLSSTNSGVLNSGRTLHFLAAGCCSFLLVLFFLTELDANFLTGMAFGFPASDSASPLVSLALVSSLSLLMALHCLLDLTQAKQALFPHCHFKVAFQISHRMLSFWHQSHLFK